MSEQNIIYGWFDDPDQTEPSCSPPRDAPCLFCGFRVHAEDVRTHNMMYQGEYAARSYFYWTHGTCAETNKPTNMDGIVLDMIKRGGN